MVSRIFSFKSSKIYLSGYIKKVLIFLKELVMPSLQVFVFLFVFSYSIGMLRISRQLLYLLLITMDDRFKII